MYATYSNFNNTDTKRRGRVVTAPASETGGPGLKSQPGDQQGTLRFSVGFPSSYKTIKGEYLRLDHDRFLQNPIKLLFVNHRTIV